MAPPLVLSVEGNIGVGKSTVLKNLRAQPDFCAANGVLFVDEPVAIWEEAGLLQAMYTGELAHGAFQQIALITRYGNICTAVKTPGVKLVIAERSIASDRAVFAETHLGPLDSKAYGCSNEALTQALGTVRDATVLLEAPIDTLEGRIRTRGREAEKSDDGGGGGVDASYLRTLDEAHARFFDSLSADHPKLRIDARVGAQDVADSVLGFIRQLLAEDEKAAADEAAAAKAINAAVAPADDREPMSPATYKISPDAESPTSVLMAPLPVLEAAAQSQ